MRSGLGAHGPLGPPRRCSRAAAHVSSGAGVARTVGFGREGAHALEALQRALLGRAAGLEEHLNVGRRRDRRARQLLHGGGRIEGRSEANAHGNDELEHCTGLRARKGRGLASAPATPSASDAALQLPQHAAGCLSTNPDRRARKLPLRAAWHSGGATFAVVIARIAHLAWRDRRAFHLRSGCEQKLGRVNRNLSTQPLTRDCD